MPSPRLLVSVRNAKEALALRDSACAIIDVKEPSRGALGMADADEIRRISDVLASNQTLSLALGEAVQLNDDVQVASRASFAKLGLGGLNGSDWEQRWLSARNLIALQQTRWVAVIYADHAIARSPEPDAIIDAAARTECVVVLVDTFNKQPGTSVFDALSVSQLTSLREKTNAANMEFALAGQLRSHHASQIADVAPDIVGIRGAACRASDRKAEIDPSLVNQFAAAVLGDRVST